MRKMSKNAWVFQMTVHGVEPDNDVIIQELINESGGLMIGKRKFSKGVSYLLVVDLLAWPLSFREKHMLLYEKNIPIEGGLDYE